MFYATCVHKQAINQLEFAFRMLADGQFRSENFVAATERVRRIGRCRYSSSSQSADGLRINKGEIIINVRWTKERRKTLAIRQP